MAHERRFMPPSLTPGWPRRPPVIEECEHWRERGREGARKRETEGGREQEIERDRERERERDRARQHQLAPPPPLRSSGCRVEGSSFRV